MNSSSAAVPRRILLLIAGVALSGIALALWVRGTFAGRPDPRTGYSAFYVIFARGEPLGLTLVAAFSLLAAVFVFRGRQAGDGSTFFLTVNRTLIAAIAAGVFAVCALGTQFVSHDYALSADEFMSDFQAQIFLRGEVTAEVPPAWRDALRIVKPTYVDYLPATHSWKAAYLPVYAAMRALFQGAYLQSFLNPLLAAVSVMALYGTARKIWPNDKQEPVIAAFLLACSAQFLVMSMTFYSMPAHLALNTIWLWLYCQPERKRFYLAPVVGVAALGLHQPIVHALFVTPFLFRLVWERRWRAVTIFAVLYSLGCAGWYAWRAYYMPPGVGAPGAIFRIWNPKMLVIQPMDILLIIGWSALATPLLFLLGIRRIWRSRPIIQDAALSCLLTLGFYCFFYLDQGHGWGYRYFHGTLSCLVLVAVAGYRELLRKAGEVNAIRFLLASFAISLLVALPLRCYQVETFVRPFARASEFIHSTNSEVVGLNPREAWYSGDLIRNDPFLENRPIVVAAIPASMKPGEVEALNQAGSGQIITRSQLHSLGLATEPNKECYPDPFRLGKGK